MARYHIDVLIVGAGAVGVAVARELCRYRMDVLVVDRLNDVGGDASKSNSAIIHTGFDAEPGTVESAMVVHGNPMFDKLCSDLDIPFKRCGALLVATTEEEEQQLPHIMDKAAKNYVYDVEYMSTEQILRREPKVTPDARGGLYIPRESIIDPFLLVTAQAENAATNGVEFLTACEIGHIRREEGSFVADSSRGEIRARYVINAAGLSGDVVSRFLGIDDFTTHPRRGQFHVIDREAPLDIQHIVLPVPTKLTKGKLLTPSVHGNWLIGPTAEELDDRHAHQTTSDGLAEVILGVKKLVPSVDPRHVITQYAGLRAVREPGGYHLRVFPQIPGYVELSGIRSTGVSGSLAIARHAVRRLKESGLETEAAEFIETRKAIPPFRDLDNTERARLIKEDSRYGRVVCRCETVTEAEIVQAVLRTPGARDLDGIKRRVRAGLGRCQGGFCGTRLPMILADLLGIPVEQVTKKGPGSELLVGTTRSPGGER
jgi:glycerol-3-phosphate dehydrogenase